MPDAIAADPTLHDTNASAGGALAHFWDLAQSTIAAHSARDGMYRALEPYYFLDADQAPNQTDDEDDTLEIVRLPHGTGVIDLVQQLLSAAPITITVPARSDTKADRAIADQAERWLAALLRINERSSGQALLDRAAWCTAMYGFFVARVLFMPDYLDKDEAGQLQQTDKPPLLLQVRDPANVYPEFAPDGLLYVVETSTHTVASLRYTWGADLLPDADPTDEVEFTEIWTRERFCYWADGQPIDRVSPSGAKGPGPWPHLYGRIPYAVRFAQQTGKREPERRVRPLLEAQRAVIDGMNKLDSIELTTAAEYGGDALIIQSTDPNRSLDLSPLAQNVMLPNESAEWLRTNRQPFEASQARAKYEAAFQRATFPYANYGQYPGRMMSGYSINLLQQAGQTPLKPIVDAIEAGFSDLLSAALAIAERLVGPILTDRTIRLYQKQHIESEGARRTIRQEIALDTRKLDGYHEVDVELGEVMPQDLATNLTLALRTQQPGANGRPLLSWRTAVDKFKLVESPSEEQSRIDEELVAQDPEVAALRRAIFSAKVKRELKDEAEALGINVDRVLAQAQQATPPVGAGGPPGPSFGAAPSATPLPAPPGYPQPSQPLPTDIPPELAAMLFGQGPPQP